VPAASVAIHLCIGSVYAWSIFNPALMRVRGVVAPAGDDWTLSQVVGVFTVAIVVLGLSAAFAGRWLEQVGPRTVGLVAAACWGGGFLVAAAGIAGHQLLLVYLGYGVLGGCGLGLGYVSPVSTLIRWFPDRRGMAAGLAIMGFGGGAMVAAPLDEWLLGRFYRPPTYLGPAAVVRPFTEHGRQFVDRDGRRIEVVVATAAEAAALPEAGPEGVYVVGTGQVGAAPTFVVLGLLYLAVMVPAALSYRVPPPDWTPPGWRPAAADQQARRMIAAGHVDLNEALRTPQFYLLWVVLCCNVTAGIGIFGVARRTMLTEIFGPPLPGVVDGAFAATFVLMISVFNMAGRFFWASASDYLGRQRTYMVFFGLGVLLYLTIPLAAWRVSVAPAVGWLVLFYAVTMLIFTMYGGGFATIPAYLADLFGTRYVGGIHGRLLTAWSTAGVLGPLLITALREQALQRALADLAARVDPHAFAARFGAPIAQLDLLIARKTVTIGRLMELAPPGTVDPSSTLYNTTMYLMAAILGVGLLANALVRPVHPRHYLAAATPP
jgi:MFS family permease